MILATHSRSEEIALLVFCVIGVTIWANFIYHLCRGAFLGNFLRRFTKRKS